MDEKPLGVIAAAGRLLTFRLSHDEFVRLDRRHLAFGLGATWLAGIGRYWDHPDAHVLQYAGLGSVIYVVVLSTFLPLDEAQTANLWFLLIVASWRVALLLLFLCRVAKLHLFLALVASLLPLALIIVGLAIANLEQAVFTIMAGNPRLPGTPADHAYEIVVLLALLSWVSSPVLLIVYLIAIYQRYAEAKHAKGPRERPTQEGMTEP